MQPKNRINELERLKLDGLASLCGVFEIVRANDIFTHRGTYTVFLNNVRLLLRVQAKEKRQTALTYQTYKKERSTTPFFFYCFM